MNELTKATAITSRLVSPQDLPQRGQDAWRQFLAPRPIAFLSYAYTRAVASCVPLVRVCCLELSGRPVGYFPFQYRSRLHAAAGIGQCLGGEASDYFGLIAEDGFRIAAEDLLRLSGLKSLFFTQLTEDQRDRGLSGSRREAGHFIDIPEGGPAFWESKRRSDKHFAADTERRERALIRAHGPISFAYLDPDPAGSLDRLIAEKRAQYRRTGVRDVLASARMRATLHALCRTQDAQCSGVISTIHAGDTWVASHFGLRAGPALHYWFPVYNPELKNFAPGRILLKQIIFNAQSQGLTRIDRGAGDSPSKRDFSTSQHFFCGGLWQRPGIAAAAHRIGLAIDWRIRSLR